MDGKLKETAKRALNNFSKIPSWNTTMNKQEAEYLLSEYSDSVFCNGSLRQIKVDCITQDLCKVYTIPY
jgi:hypothetical protein